MIVIIQKSIKKRLERDLSIHEPRLKLDVMLYIVSLINKLPSYHRADDLIEYVPLNATKLKKEVHSDYKNYLDYLIKYGIIEKGKKYCTITKESNSFKIRDEYFYDEIIAYEITIKRFKAKLLKFETYHQSLPKVLLCASTRQHLISNFDEHLVIDYESAMEELNSLNRVARENKDLKMQRRYVNCAQLIIEWFDQKWSYSMNPETDNRLHTTLTRTPKLLRPYITYKNERIVGLDLKSSQLYFFCSILGGIHNKDLAHLKRIGVTEVVSEEILQKIFKIPTNQENLKEFMLTVLQKDFYDEFQKIIPIDYNLNGEPTRRKSNFKKGKKYDKDSEAYSIVKYEDPRTLTKKVIMEIFNSKPRTNIIEAKIFKNAYPYVWEVMSFIKNQNIAFYRVMSFVEAKCLLDYAAKELKNKYPDIILFSIHDSIWTVESKIDIVKRQVTKYIKDFTRLHIPPLLKEENTIIINQLT